MNCPNCSKKIDDTIIIKYVNTRAASVRTEKTAAAARENGKKGGRPKKIK